MSFKPEDPKVKFQRQPQLNNLLTYQQPRGAVTPASSSKLIRATPRERLNLGAGIMKAEAPTRQVAKTASFIFKRVVLVVFLWVVGKPEERGCGVHQSKGRALDLNLSSSLLVKKNHAKICDETWLITSRSNHFRCCRLMINCRLYPLSSDEAHDGQITQSNKEDFRHHILSDIIMPCFWQKTPKARQIVLNCYTSRNKIQQGCKKEGVEF